MDKQELKKLIATLHPLELKVLPYMVKSSSLKGLIAKTGLKEVEVMRALQWLQNKGIIGLKAETKQIIGLDKNGERYLKAGLPEKRFLSALKGKELELKALKTATGLGEDELNLCMGLLKKKAAIKIKKEGDNFFVSVTEAGAKLLDKESLEEKLIRKLSGGAVDAVSLAPEEKFAYEELKKRKGILKTNVAKIRTITFTALGKELSKVKIRAEKVIDRLTPEIIKTGGWKGKPYRRYDVKSDVPKIYGGKRHFVKQAITYVKKIWLELGFKEMTGPMLDTSFWNFDSLFVPQDHPAREMQDTFYIKNPETGKLPGKKLMSDVKSVHENGGSTGSKGWEYIWSPEEAKRNVLRTHTTIISAKTISALKESDLPAKFFSVGKCFRNEAVDWKHLFELTQVEGIVIDPEANFKHLIGYLKEFFKKLGYEKVRVRPAYFPYTEPSAEVEVFHPVKKEWVELGGSGLFRPEVVVPLLGKDVPVLAWGMGLERSISEYFNITDIRDLYKNDLRQLREIRKWMM